MRINFLIKPSKESIEEAKRVGSEYIISSDEPTFLNYSMFSKYTDSSTYYDLIRNGKSITTYYSSTCRESIYYTYTDVMNFIKRSNIYMPNFNLTADVTVTITSDFIEPNERFDALIPYFKDKQKLDLLIESGKITMEFGSLRKYPGCKLIFIGLHIISGVLGFMRDNISRGKRGGLKAVPYYTYDGKELGVYNRLDVINQNRIAGSYGIAAFFITNMFNTPTAFYESYTNYNGLNSFMLMASATGDNKRYILDYCKKFNTNPRIFFAQTVKFHGGSHIHDLFTLYDFLVYAPSHKTKEVLVLATEYLNNSKEFEDDYSHLSTREEEMWKDIEIPSK